MVTLIKKLCRGLPGGSVVKNLPDNAGDTGLILGLGGSHMLRNNKAHETQLLSLCSRAWEPQLRGRYLESLLHNKRSHLNEKAMYHNQRALPAPN